MAGEGAGERRLAGSIASVTISAAGAAQATSGTADRSDPAGTFDPAGPAGIVIAVDGPSGSGKSSAARGVARALGLSYLDTGAMYRAVACWMLDHGVDVADARAVSAHARELSVEISTDPTEQVVRIGGADLTAAIRTRPVTNAVSAVASIPEIRGQLIARQRDLIGQAARTGTGIVAEGRDIGTVVVPDAAVKIYLTASEQARAERRAAELPAATAELTLAEQARRDRKDAPQSQPAADAVEIDATELTLDEVIARIVELAGQFQRPESALPAQSAQSAQPVQLSQSVQQSQSVQLPQRAAGGGAGEQADAAWAR